MRYCSREHPVVDFLNFLPPYKYPDMNKIIVERLEKAEGEAFGKKGNDVFRKLETMPVPTIAAINGESAAIAKSMIDAIVFEPEVGCCYNATVVKILASKDKPNEDVGCFVEYAPGKEGMVHISKITNRRLEKVEDAGIELGTVVRVKYLGLDKKGRMDFSIKDAD